MSRKMLPQMALPDLEGNNFSFEQLRGKNTLIYMWASW